MDSWLTLCSWSMSTWWREILSSQCYSQWERETDGGVLMQVLLHYVKLTLVLLTFQGNEYFSRLMEGPEDLIFTVWRSCKVWACICFWGCKTPPMSQRNRSKLCWVEKLAMKAHSAVSEWAVCKVLWSRTTTTTKKCTFSSTDTEPISLWAAFYWSLHRWWEWVATIPAVLHLSFSKDMFIGSLWGCSMDMSTIESLFSATWTRTNSGRRAACWPWRHPWPCVARVLITTVWLGLQNTAGSHNIEPCFLQMVRGAWV